MEKAFRENEVLLWGVNPVKKSLLEQYDKGNKNPLSLSRKGKKAETEQEEKTPKKSVKKVREFSLDEDYSPADLDFLNEEYERIDILLSSGKLSRDEEDDLSDKQDKLYDLIEGLEAMKKLQGKGIFSDVKNTIKKGVEYSKAVFYGRGDEYPPKVRNIIERYGNEFITGLTLMRTPVPNILTKALSLLSGGQFQENLDNSPYDTLFHLFLVINTGKGPISLEKNEVINMDTNPKPRDKTETKQVRNIPRLTVLQLLENTRKRMGNRFFVYSARDNNCQDFMQNVFIGNRIGDYSDLEFIKQDTAQLFKDLPYLSKIADAITTTGERVNILTTGRGFTKGSPEAIAHAEKMRKAIEAKKAAKAVPAKEPVKQASKARAEKGSEAAKELGRRLAEARMRKAQAKKTEKEEEKKKVKQEKTKNYKPWYYIGDIPRGYREATEDEAITHGKVSTYGKYVVDPEKYKLYTEFDMLLTVQRPEQEIKWSMTGLKKRIMKSLEDIEIYKSKLENDKYKDKWPEFESKLKQEKLKRKTLQAGWNWYHKYFSEKEGIKYEPQKFKLETKEIAYQPSTAKVYKKPVIIDPRTGKPAEEYKPEPEEKKVQKKQTIDIDLFFKKGKDIIQLSTKYFTSDYKLKPKYTEKLLKKGIILQKNHYTPEDYEKYFYKIAIGGGFEGYGLIKSN